MKVKLNIEIFDDSNLKKCEEYGFGVKALETMYKISFDSLLKEVCAEGGSNYTLSVEVEDNTVVQTIQN